MNYDWRARTILSRFAAGSTYVEAASAGGISKQALLKRMKVSPDFSQAVAAARKEGEAERVYRLWLRHPFRGKRPPTGKGHGGKPRFCYGRK